MATTPAVRKIDLDGVALWRRIADDLRLDIVAGKFAEGFCLPAETALAQRFEANRHTVRRALAALRAEGLVEAAQGRGTFVSQVRRLRYGIGRRTRLSEGLAGQTRATRGELLCADTEIATAAVARALALAPPEQNLTRLETLHFADDRPVSRASSWFSLDRFPGLAEAFAATGSMTAALRQCGLMDYTRLSTRITARRADAGESKTLRLAPGSVVLVAEAVNIDADGRPVQYAVTRFPADRIELSIES